MLPGKIGQRGAIDQRFRQTMRANSVQTNNLLISDQANPHQPNIMVKYNIPQNQIKKGSYEVRDSKSYNTVVNQGPVKAQLKSGVFDMEKKYYNTKATTTGIDSNNFYGINAYNGGQKVEMTSLGLPFAR